jgi:hypothetical protein
MSTLRNIYEVNIHEVSRAKIPKRFARYKFASPHSGLARSAEARGMLFALIGEAIVVAMPILCGAIKN